MRYLLVLLFLLIMSFCHADSWRTNAPLYDNPFIPGHYSSFEPNPIDYPDNHYKSRYINDLGHEFPIISVVDGSYWKGGAWGYKNGINNYYGNEFFMSPNYQIGESYLTIPEPSTLLLLGSSTILFIKNRRSRYAISSWKKSP